MSSYYELLSVARDANEEALKKSYKKAALKHHPDKGGNEETFKAIKVAYETLSDPAKRLQYDRELIAKLKADVAESTTAYTADRRSTASSYTAERRNSSSYGDHGTSRMNTNPNKGPPRRVPTNVEDMTARELKELLSMWGVRHDDCFERQDFISKVKTHCDSSSAYSSTGNSNNSSSYASNNAYAGSSTSSSVTNPWDENLYKQMTAAVSSTSGARPPVVRVKVISMGPSNSGKSCLIKRFCEGRFVPRYISTIGVDYGVKAVNVGNQRVKVNFFDLSGHEAFKDIRIDFYEAAQGVLLCYDATSVDSFRKLQSNWLWEARGNGLNFASATCVLCANKADLPNRAVSTHEGQNYAKDNGFLYYELSANSGEGVVQAFSSIFEKILDKLKAEAKDLNVTLGQNQILSGG